MLFYLGLVHYPVYNKTGETIASAITTLDLHDLARLGRTYGASKLFVITPLEDQQELARRILAHWLKGYGASYNPDRREALKLMEIASSIEEAIEAIGAETGDAPITLATDASPRGRSPMSFQEARKLVDKKKPIFLLFGTAWGLHQEVLDSVDYVLEPIWGRTGYNHLSVRTAAAIIVDRLVAGPQR